MGSRTGPAVNQTPLMACAVGSIGEAETAGGGISGSDIPVTAGWSRPSGLPRVARTGTRDSDRATCLTSPIGHTVCRGEIYVASDGPVKTGGQRWAAVPDRATWQNRRKATLAGVALDMAPARPCRQAPIPGTGHPGEPGMGGRSYRGGSPSRRRPPDVGDTQLEAGLTEARDQPRCRVRSWIDGDVDVGVSRSINPVEDGGLGHARGRPSGRSRPRHPV
jgi:hypothetical protein